MKQRYRKFKRGWGVWYVYDNTNGNSQSLNTRSKPEAERLVHSVNEAERQPILNRQIARAYLMAADPQAVTRTWGFVPLRFQKRPSSAKSIQMDQSN
jgi:hypothetical protein